VNLYTYRYDDPQEIEAKALQSYVDPIAIAHRKSHATRTWDSGFIWVADAAKAKTLIGGDWTTTDILQGTLLHELGHVLGCAHFAGTIMREDIVTFLSKAVDKTAPTRKVMMSNVDWEDELLMYGFDYNSPGLFADPQGCSYCPPYFQEMMGRSPVGKIGSRLWRGSITPTHIVIYDDVGQKDFVIEDNNTITTITRQETAFKYFGSNGGQGGAYGGGGVYVSVGKITVANGLKTTVMLQRGGGATGAWEVYYTPLKAGDPWLIFARLPGGIPVDSP